jgi:hypothetical protein
MGSEVWIYFFSALPTGSTGQPDVCQQPSGIYYCTQATGAPGVVHRVRTLDGVHAAVAPEATNLGLAPRVYAVDAPNNMQYFMATLPNPNSSPEPINSFVLSTDGLIFESPLTNLQGEARPFSPHALPFAVSPCTTDGAAAITDPSGHLPVNSGTSGTPATFISSECGGPNPSPYQTLQSSGLYPIYGTLYWQ